MKPERGKRRSRVSALILVDFFQALPGMIVRAMKYRPF
jgi:hypothetical protein